MNRTPQIASRSKIGGDYHVTCKGTLYESEWDTDRSILDSFQGLAQFFVGRRAYLPACICPYFEASMNAQSWLRNQHARNV
jgi:hypothetical protein